MRIINLTPHTINEVETGETFPPSGSVARVEATYNQVGMLENIRLFKVEYGEIEGLPEPEDGIVYIVSGMVKAATDRVDVVAPGELVRDESGKPIGCRGFKI